MKALRMLALAGALAAGGGAHAFPVPAGPTGPSGVAIEPVQVICGPYRCFAPPFWRYRSGAGFRPSGRFGFVPARPRFAPFGLRRPGAFGFRRPGPFGGFRRF